MKKYLKTIIKVIFYLFLFLVPWQTRLFLVFDSVKGAYSEFGSISLYAVDFLVIGILLLAGYKTLSDQKKIANMKISLLWSVLIAFDLIFLFSIFRAENWGVAVYKYLLFLLGLGLFFIIRNYSYYGIKKIKIFYALISGLALQAVLGIYQFLTQSTFACKYLGLAEHLPYGLSGESVLENASGRWLRAYGGLDHPNIFGALMALAVIITIYLLVSKKVAQKWDNLNIALLFVFMLALFFSFSRGAWLGLVAGLLVWGLVAYRTKVFNLKLEFLRKPLFWGALILLFLFFIEYGNLISTRVAGGDRLEIRSLSERTSYYDDAGIILKNDWLTGVGAGNYVTKLEEIKTTQPFWYYQPIHNTFVLIWAELGVVGLILFLFFLGILLGRLPLKLKSSGFNLGLFAALLVVMLLEHWLFSLHFGILFLWIWLGIISLKNNN
jgi:hypothetical protein